MDWTFRKNVFNNSCCCGGDGSGGSGGGGGSGIYFPLGNRFTFSADVNYSSGAHTVFFDVLNGVTTTPSGANNIYTNYITNSDLDITAVSNNTIDAGGTWINILRNGVYSIHVSFLWDTQNATHPYYNQIQIKRNGVPESFTHSQNGQAIILQSSQTQFLTTYTGTFNAGDSFCYQIYADAALNAGKNQPTIGLETAMEVARII